MKTILNLFINQSKETPSLPTENLPQGHLMPLPQARSPMLLWAKSKVCGLSVILSAIEGSTNQEQANVPSSCLWATSSREPPPHNRGLRTLIVHITLCNAFCTALGL